MRHCVYNLVTYVFEKSPEYSSTFIPNLTNYITNNSSPKTERRKSFFIMKNSWRFFHSSWRPTSLMLPTGGDVTPTSGMNVWHWMSLTRWLSFQFLLFLYPFFSPSSQKNAKKKKIPFPSLLRSPLESLHHSFRNISCPNRSHRPPDTHWLRMMSSLHVPTFLVVYFKRWRHVHVDITYLRDSTLGEGEGTCPVTLSLWRKLCYDSCIITPVNEWIYYLIRFFIHRSLCV